MSKPVTLEWNAFLAGDIVTKDKRPTVSLAAKTAGAVHLMLVPQSAFAAAAGEATWNEIFEMVLNIADWLCVGIIVYSGVTWMFTNRTKAIEYLMGGSIGYIIIRHAVDIKDWLKLL